MPLDSKHIDTNFSPDLTDLLLAQVLISPDLAIFVSTTMATELIALPLAGAHGVISIHPLWMTFNECPGGPTKVRFNEGKGVFYANFIVSRGKSIKSCDIQRDALYISGGGDRRTNVHSPIRLYLT